MVDIDHSRVVTSPDNERLKRLTTIVYLLQALSFIIPITFLAALIVNYVKRSEVRGTIYESHFRWQIRTFWYTAIWFFVGYLSLIVLVGYLILLGGTLWVIYRIARGWFRLSENQSI
jgi:uncharacterized membrane protein